MLYQLSYASRSWIGPLPFGDKTPSDPFLMSGTILKVTITAFCVQGDGGLMWVGAPPAVFDFLLIAPVAGLQDTCDRNRLNLKLWETVGMPKRNLRIVKRVKNVPVIGICESLQGAVPGRAPAGGPAGAGAGCDPAAVQCAQVPACRIPMIACYQTGMRWWICPSG